MLRLLSLLTLLLLGITCLDGAVVSWWRFESDTDPSVSALSNPNEITTEPAMVSTNAVLGNQVPDLFNNYVPGANVPNTASVRSYINGGGNDGIFGTAGYSSTLNVNSITVEFWVRTTENEAGFVSRTTNAANSGETVGDLPDGFKIVDPQNVRVEFRTSRIDGSNVQYSTITSNIAVNDGAWHYIAYRYDTTTKTGKLTVDSTTSSLTLGGGQQRRLWWGDTSAQPTVNVGYRLDGNPNNQTGTLDELRFSDTSVPDNGLLITPVPEPATITLGVLLLGWSAVDYRRRARKRS
ncbi:MAG: LamG-like jellyroll fold domain-containing protein [Verrucomicrobiota bacterium]|nr:LamG-like jellyroll fold domain-containing protein [Verrucomicrobiota bacterium]